MIWLFEVNEVFWNEKPKVNKVFVFDGDDVHFDITQYDISLYFALSDYFILSSSTDGDIYQLRFKSVSENPSRLILPQNTEMYNTIRQFYIDELKKKNEKYEKRNNVRVKVEDRTMVEKDGEWIALPNSLKNKRKKLKELFGEDYNGTPKPFFVHSVHINEIKRVFQELKNIDDEENNEQHR